MFGRLLILLLSIPLYGVHEYHYYTDASLLQEALEERGVHEANVVCTKVLELCDAAYQHIDNYHCRFNHYANFPRGGFFMDFYIEEKATNKVLCAFEFNLQTKTLKEK